MIRSKGKHDSFMGYVELHERAWGMDSYPGRPKLEDILQAPIVVFWYPAKGRDVRHTITLYHSLRELNEQMSHLLLHSKSKVPERRLSRLFIKQQQIEIKGVQLVLAKGDQT